MSFSIDEFKANATKHGFIRPSFFLVAFPAPPAWYGGETRFLTYLCSGANLPGPSVITSDERVAGYGKTRKVPYDAAHTDLSLTFYSDGNAQTLAFFENWMRNIVVYGQDRANVKGALRGEVHYPDHYETQMEIFQYNENPGDDRIEIIKYTINQAFPLSLGEQQLSWDQGDQISTLGVTLAFKDYWVEKNITNKAAVLGNAGKLETMTRDRSYLQEFERGGFEADWQNRVNRYDSAEGITAGMLGLDYLAAPLGIISKYSSLINDKLNVVNNIGSSVNSVLGSYASLLNKRPPSIPGLPNIQFP